VAVSQVVRNAGSPAQNVDQPLPMPARVSNSAIGAGVAQAAEPELVLLVALVVACALGAFLLRARRARLAA
jgi:hypothetical protein